MQSSFKGRTVIVTGASMGVGAAVARAFARLEANLVLLARGEKKLQELVSELDAGDRVHGMSMDVTDIQAFKDLLADTKSRFGGVDVLVNNAGFHQRGPVETIEADDLGRMIDVNLKAPIMATRLALPYLRKATTPAVINVASLAGRTPIPGAAAYSASKFGIRVFGLALAEELRGSGIKIAAVSPGPIDTGFIMDQIDQVTNLTFSQPISTAEEVADMVVKLVTSDKAEQAMPPISGVLTTLTYLMPGLGRLMRPLLERKGRRTKARLKRERG
ncbi:MAG: SDR family oxidoreductase [Pseudomonadota bacterium]